MKLSLEFDEPTTYAEIKDIWARIDAIVKPHHGFVEQVFKYGQHYTPHLRLVTD